MSKTNKIIAWYGWLPDLPDQRDKLYSAMAAPRSAPDLSHIETWVFDLDNTLYCASTRVFDQIGERMTGFIAQKFGLDLAAAADMRRAYYHSHGTTLSGLMAIEGQEPQEFLAHVLEHHDLADLVQQSAGMEFLRAEAQFDA